MARKHNTKNRAPTFSLHLGEDGGTSWPTDAITNALLADILKDASAMRESLWTLRRIADTLDKIDRRLLRAGYTLRAPSKNAGKK